MTPSDNRPSSEDELKNASAAFVRSRREADGRAPEKALEVEGLWASMDAISDDPAILALRADVRARYRPQAANDPSDVEDRSGYSARRAPYYAMAAAVLIAVGLGSWHYLRPSPDGAQSPEAGRLIANAQAAPRSYALPDGSRITLDAQSAVRLEADGSRRAELVRGAAFFHVRHDAREPFVVQAGDNRLVDLGTAFSVERRSDGLRVILVEGSVRVDMRAATGPASVTLQPGQGLHLAGGKWQVDALDADRETGWRTGFITFDNVAAADAVKRLNRYLPVGIQLRHEQDRDVRISGVFRTANQAEAIRGLSAMGVAVAAR